MRVLSGYYAIYQIAKPFLPEKVEMWMLWSYILLVDQSDLILFELSAMCNFFLPLSLHTCIKGWCNQCRYGLQRAWKVLKLPLVHEHYSQQIQKSALVISFKKRQEGVTLGALNRNISREKEPVFWLLVFILCV